MGLKMKHFNIIGVPWKIWFLSGGHKNQYGSKRGLGQFADLRRDLAKKRVLVILRGAWYPNLHYDDKNILWIFPKMPSEIFCSKICWQNSAKVSFIYQQWTATALISLKVPTTDSLVFFQEYISRTAMLTQASVLTCK